MLLEAILSPREPGMVRSASDWLSLIWVTYLGLFVKLLRASERPPHPVPLPPGERGPFLPPLPRWERAGVRVSSGLTNNPG